MWARGGRQGCGRRGGRTRPRQEVKDEAAAATSPAGALASDFRPPGLRGDKSLPQLPRPGHLVTATAAGSVSPREGQRKILQENGVQVRLSGREGQPRRQRTGPWEPREQKAAPGNHRAANGLTAW